MAVVKVKYVTSKHQIKVHLRYIVHRVGRDREKMSRQLFTSQGTVVEKDFAYRLIETLTKGGAFYKAIINFDPVKEDGKKDLNVHAITEKVMHRFQALIQQEVAKPLDFIAVLHDDHTDKRHIHAIVFVHGRVRKETFRALSTDLRAAAFQEISRQHERDYVREQLREGKWLSLHPAHRAKRAQDVQARPARLGFRRLECGHWQELWTTQAHQCEKQPQLELKREEQGFELEQELELGLSL
jgi:hypothetical protein